ncbi:hypothetical protein E6O75_ATG10186 [Venturia nashicola]|uniref:Uncharacterized protein n=1 Tax=Venturia nashicola TaxID=86259 RepID=A0A4Z1P188_9PEZI|nr:hypothetical protein E6O75_ATG10186 [Venturia nashicola]
MLPNSKVTCDSSQYREPREHNIHCRLSSSRVMRPWRIASSRGAVIDESYRTQQLFRRHRFIGVGMCWRSRRHTIVEEQESRHCLACAHGRSARSERMHQCQLCPSLHLFEVFIFMKWKGCAERSKWRMIFEEAKAFRMASCEEVGRRRVMRTALSVSITLQTQFLLLAVTGSGADYENDLPDTRNKQRVQGDFERNGIEIPP